MISRRGGKETGNERRSPVAFDSDSRVECKTLYADCTRGNLYHRNQLNQIVSFHFLGTPLVRIPHYRNENKPVWSPGAPGESSPSLAPNYNTCARERSRRPIVEPRFPDFPHARSVLLGSSCAASNRSTPRHAFASLSTQPTRHPTNAPTTTERSSPGATHQSSFL